jgi:hypothetical protein
MWLGDGPNTTAQFLLQIWTAESYTSKLNILLKMNNIFYILETAFHNKVLAIYCVIQNIKNINQTKNMRGEHKYCSRIKIAERL